VGDPLPGRVSGSPPGYGPGACVFRS
jgi:hypothetical protein